MSYRGNRSTPSTNHPEEAVSYSNRDTAEDHFTKTLSRLSEDLEKSRSDMYFQHTLPEGSHEDSKRVSDIFVEEVRCWRKATTEMLDSIAEWGIGLGDNDERREFAKHLARHAESMSDAGNRLMVGIQEYYSPVSWFRLAKNGIEDDFARGEEPTMARYRFAENYWLWKVAEFCSPMKTAHNKVLNSVLDLMQASHTKDPSRPVKSWPKLISDGIPRREAAPYTQIL